MVQITPTQVLLGGGVAFLLSLYVVISGWLGWASLFRLYPLLSIPCALSLFVAPTFLYIGARRMTEVGPRGRLLIATLLSAVAMGLIILGMTLWLRHWTTP